MKKVLLFTFLFFVILLSCKGRVTVDEAYNAIRPVKQLELPSQIAENLVVEIKNVADPRSSYKNRVELYLNDRPIDPDWLVSNIQNTFVYKFRLRPGYYKLRAVYIANIGWGEEEYPILSEDLIRVQHDKRTVVTAEIVKKPNGEPVNRTMYFTARMESLEMEYVPTGATESDFPLDDGSGQVLLQINTVPEHAQIIIDDKVVGQSPLRTPVSRTSGHVLQVSSPGYRTKTIYLDQTKFGNKEIYHVIAELEKE